LLAGRPHKQRAARLEYENQIASIRLLWLTNELSGAPSSLTI
jgi:hypothetical protein